MRRLLIILLALLAIPVSQPAMSSGAQPDDKQDFYIITFNNENHDTSLWRIGLTEPSMELIYRVTTPQYTSPRDTFPEDETSALDRVVADGHLQYLHADQPTVSRYIDKAWALDTQRMILLERVEACNVIDNICYGYFDFEMVDLASGQVTSIYEISYHGEAFNEWQCSIQRGLIFVRAFPNPLYDQFAFTFKSFDCYSDTHQPTAGYIVDFSTTPAQVTYLPEADGLSWSPDGTYLAYFTRPACFTSGESTINVLPVNPSAPLIVLQKEAQACQNIMFTGWLDNETIMYSWKAGVSGSESPSYIFRHNVITNKISSAQLDVFTLSETIFSLQNGSTRNTLGVRFRDSAVQYSATDEIVLPDLEIERLFYNSRLNSYAFINIDQYNITRLDADLTTTLIDLSPLLANYPEERLIYVTPG